MVASYPQATQYQQNGHVPNNHQIRHPMDSRATPAEYPSAALSSNSYQSYTSTHLDPQNGEQSATPPQQQQQQQQGQQQQQQQHQQQQSSAQDARSTYSNSATPTSETSAIYSARTPTFAPEQIIGAPRYVQDGAHRYQPTSTSSAGMTRNISTTNSPTLKAEPKLSEDPTVAAPSPSSFAPGHYGSQYPPGQHAMQEGYSHPGTPTQQWRQDWSSPYGPSPHQMSQSPYGHAPSPTSMGAGPPGMVSTSRPPSANKANRKRSGDTPTGHPLSQVYSFVPIPGAQQNKRPRRRYEEIERMYKCGWNGCEKAYGTLNHLNAHVTMQGHGAKRTPEEFKEIRKEWKARKKEEEAQRKAAEEEARRRAQEEVASTTSAEPQPAVSSAQYVSGMPPQRQLPPLSYQPSVSLPNGVQYAAATSSAPTAPMESMQQYGGQQMYSTYPPAQQYAGQQQMFAGQQRAATSQSNGNTNTTTGGEEPDADAEPDPDISAAPTYSS